MYDLHVVQKCLVDPISSCGPVLPEKLASIPLGYSINYWEEMNKINMLRRLQEDPENAKAWRRTALIMYSLCLVVQTDLVDCCKDL